MANKPKRLTVGSVIKNKDPSMGYYIKISADVTLKKGDILSLQSKQQALASVDYLLNNKKISPAVAEEMRQSAEKIPDFVRFRVIQKLAE